MLRRLIGVAKLVIINDMNIMAFLDDCVTSHDAQLATNLQFKVRLNSSPWWNGHESWHCRQVASLSLLAA